MWWNEPWYHILSLTLAAAGVGLGVVALWVAVVQVRKAVGAAEAAKDAALATRERMLEIGTLTGGWSMGEMAEAAVASLTSGELQSAARRVRDLRIALAQRSERSIGQEAKESRRLIRLCIEASEALRTQAALGSRSRSAEELEKVLRYLEQVQESLGAATGRTILHMETRDG